MDRNYWIVFIILIAIMCYAFITFQWLLGVIACIVVVIIALVLSQVQHQGKTSIWFRMDRNSWIVFIILIAIISYAFITFQWLLGVIACIVVVIITLVLSHLQHWGKTSQ